MNLSCWWMLRRSPLLLLLPLLSFAAACTASAGDDEDTGTTADGLALPVDIDAPGLIRVETVVSATWTSATAGLVNLWHPAARAAGIPNEKVPIVLSVHLVRHPTRGTFAIDTGVPKSWVAGSKDNLPGLVAGGFTADITPVRALADIVDQPLAGVFLTHMH